MKKLLVLTALIISSSAFAFGGSSENISTSTTSASRQDQQAASNASNQIGCLVNCASTDAGQIAAAAAVVTSAQINANAAREIAATNADAAKSITTINGQTARAVAGTSQTIKNTPSVAGPNLTSSNDTCMGSASGSLNAPGFGLSLGKTYTDANCVMLKNSRELWNMGMKAASMALMCSDPANKEALELTGYVCPTRDSMQLRSSTTVANPAVSGEPTDPYVRARMGLPALTK